MRVCLIEVQAYIIFILVALRLKVTRITVHEVTSGLIKGMSEVRHLQYMVCMARHHPSSVLRSGKGLIPTGSLEAWGGGSGISGWEG